MKDKNLLDDIKNKSLNELTELANNIIEKLENEKDLENSINDYQELIKLNNLIEKKFQNTSKEISQETKNKDTKNILNSIISDINATDIDSLSPREALEKLYTYDKSIKKVDK